MKIAYTLFLILFAGGVNAQCLEGDCENGKGKIKCDCGYIYEGEFKDGKKVKGVMTKKELVYTGEFKDDLAHGKGKIVYKDGSYYEGDFKFNSPDGNGVYGLKNGWIYKGGLKAGNFSGYGIKYFEHKENEHKIIRLGEFKKDHLNGLGFYKEFNGDFYLGEFKDGRFWGVGVYLFIDSGEIEPGIYKKGKIQDRIESDLPNNWKLEFKDFIYEIDITDKGNIISFYKRNKESISLVARYIKSESKIYFGESFEGGKGITLDFQGNQTNAIIEE